MWLTLLLFLIGFFLLIKGADILVEGSSSIAKKLKISDLVIGLTIVAFGTSAPELIISVIAAIKGSTGISLGNVIGSNISNTLLILGVAAIVTPLTLKKNTVNKEIPFSLLAVVAVAIMINDYAMDGYTSNALTRSDGLVLMLFFAIFMYYTFGISKQKTNVLENISQKDDIKVYSAWQTLLMVVLGLAGLYFGGQWIVNGAKEIAFMFGLSEALVGLTIVAIGTSLPELAASVVAARKGRADMAIGNVVGSNIFNFIWVLGLSSAISPINFDTALNFDILTLVGITVILLMLIYVGKKNILDKYEGIALLSLYVMYISYLIYRG
ncbi:calcium/sodium antiporter [Candidatus Falkowbacteria bacterium]|nr:calcium/sodium antiporter [Candidatus Falkowbacteria bacterium]